jgi:hypothetical protein
MPSGAVGGASCGETTVYGDRLRTKPRPSVVQVLPTASRRLQRQDRKCGCEKPANMSTTSSRPGVCEIGRRPHTRVECGHVVAVRNGVGLGIQISTKLHPHAASRRFLLSFFSGAARKGQRGPAMGSGKTMSTGGEEGRRWEERVFDERSTIGWGVLKKRRPPPALPHEFPGAVAARKPSQLIARERGLRRRGGGGTSCRGGRWGQRWNDGRWRWDNSSRWRRRRP